MLGKSLPCSSHLVAAHVPATWPASALILFVGRLGDEALLGIVEIALSANGTLRLQAFAGLERELRRCSCRADQSASRRSRPCRPASAMRRGMGMDRSRQQAGQQEHQRKVYRASFHGNPLGVGDRMKREMERGIGSPQSATAGGERWREHTAIPGGAGDLEAVYSRAVALAVAFATRGRWGRRQSHSDHHHGRKHGNVRDLQSVSFWLGRLLRPPWRRSRR